jgi:hypothetical protein
MAGAAVVAEDGRVKGMRNAERERRERNRRNNGYPIDLAVQERKSLFSECVLP